MWTNSARTVTNMKILSPASDLRRRLQSRYNELLDPPRSTCTLYFGSGCEHSPEGSPCQAQALVRLEPAVEPEPRSHHRTRLGEACHGREDALCGVALLQEHACTIKVSTETERLPFATGSFDLVSTFALLCTTPLTKEFAVELARVMQPGATVGGIVPSSQITPERVAGLLEGDERSDAVSCMIGALPHRFPRGVSERSLVTILRAGQLRSIRTEECLDGVLLLFKARL